MFFWNSYLAPFIIIKTTYSHPGRIATQQVRNTGKLLQFDKERLQKSTPNVLFNGERFDAFPLHLEARQGCPFLPLLFHIVLEILANVIKQEKQAIQTGNCLFLVLVGFVVYFISYNFPK